MATTHDALSARSFTTVRAERSPARFSQNGGGDAFASLYETHLDQIYRYIYFRVDDYQLAEDITSLVFLKAWEHRDRFQGGQIPFAKWIYRIAHNTLIDYYRTRKHVVALEDVHPLQLSHADGVDEKIDIDILSQQQVKALGALTSTQREVLILRFVLGLTTLEIAHRLDKGQGAIRALQMRGLRRLARNPAFQKGRIYEW